jgi:hypothetical protein
MTLLRGRPIRALSQAAVVIVLSVLGLPLHIVGVARAAMAGIPSGQPRVLSASPQDFVEHLLSGGPGKDGIPSIDLPSFIDAKAANAVLDDRDIVLGVYQGGQARAYPRNIMA